MLTLLLVPLLAFAPLLVGTLGSETPTLSRVVIGSRCAVEGNLARSGRQLAGCKVSGAVLRWVRTPARIVIPTRLVMRSNTTTETSAESERVALVLDGQIIGIIVGAADLAPRMGLRTMALAVDDPAALGERAGGNRIVFDDPASRHEPLAPSGCLANNCGEIVRNYALLRGNDVLNVIVWDGQPLLGSGTPIVPGIAIVERRAGEPIGPGTRILEATDAPLQPSGPAERVALTIDGWVVAIVDGIASLELPDRVVSTPVRDNADVAPGWLQQANGSFVDPEAPPPVDPSDEEGGNATPAPTDAAPAPSASNNGGAAPAPSESTIPSEPISVPTPRPWYVDPSRASTRPIGTLGAYAIIGGGKTINTVVLDPSSTGGQSWIEWFNTDQGRNHLGADATLVQIDYGTDWTQPGHETIVGPTPAP